MNNDDKQIGRILTRREAVAILGAAGASLLTGCSPGQSSAANSSSAAASSAAPTSAASLPGCVVRPEQTQGPYFVDERLNRSDIRSDPSDGTVREGIPLELTFAVSQLGSGSCTPISGAVVDVWHCDADGVYSDVQDPGFNTLGKKYLRGYQVTDASGRAKFTTIYPGWYRGRAVHIHFTVRTNAAGSSGHQFTSQIYFDDAQNDEVFSKPPYKGKGQIRNAQDGIFRDGGSQLVLALKPAGSGYAGTFDLAMQTT
jgi:protocatechuate 3,4-dioxygenase beta subunit